MAWPCTPRALALAASLTLALSSTPSSAGPKADDLLDAPAGDKAPAAGKKAKEAAKEPAGPKVTVLDKGDLLADPSAEGKVLKKLRKKEKLEFVERSSDGKYAKVHRGKIEGWVLAEQLEGLPPAPAPDPATQTAAGADGKSATGDGKAAGVASATPPPAPEPPKPPEPPQEKTPAVAPKPEVPPPPPVVADSRPPMSGIWLSVGGGVALLGSSIAATTQTGLTPELYNYQINSLPALAVQASLGYTFAYRGLRVGLDGGYRFAGATSVVVQLPDRDSLPMTVAGGGMTTTVLKTPKQLIPTTGHDGDVAFSIGGYIALPARLDLSLRARAGFQMFGFLPEFNNATPLPQEVFYGPHVGAVVEFGSRFIPGFGLRLSGGYIPYAVRVENAGLRDGQQDSSTGYFLGASAAVRLLRGFDVELAYRMLSTTSSYLVDSNPERLKYDRDPTIRGRYMTEKLALNSDSSAPTRSTSQQTITLGLVFLRQ